MGSAKEGRRVDKRKAGVPFVAGTEAGSAEASAEKEAGTAVYRNNADCDPSESDLDV